MVKVHVGFGDEWLCGRLSGTDKGREVAGRKDVGAGRSERR